MKWNESKKIAGERLVAIKKKEKQPDKGGGSSAQEYQTSYACKRSATRELHAHAQHHHVRMCSLREVVCSTTSSMHLFNLQNNFEEYKKIIL